jgi:hypothetical protein
MKIKLSELRQMVKAVIKEETATSNTYKYATPVKKKFLDKSGKPFNATGVNWNGEYKVLSETLLSNGKISIKTVEPIELIFNCQDKQFYMNKTKVSNLTYTIELQSRFCSSGTTAGTGKAPSLGGGGYNTSNLINQQVRLYSDEANTQEAYVVTITKVVNKGSFVDILSSQVTADGRGRFTFSCKDNFIKMSGGTGELKYYNKKYIAELKKAFCTKSAGGSDVINIGTYSQTDQKEPMNVAESQLRKIVKSIIKEEQDCGCSK